MKWKKSSYINVNTLSVTDVPFDPELSLTMQWYFLQYNKSYCMMYSMFVHCPNNIYVFFETRNENYACFVFFASTYVYCMVHTVNNKVCISQKNVENLSKPYEYLNVKRISFEVLLFLSQVATIFCPYTPPRLSRFYFFTYIFWICVSVQ